MIQTTKRDKQIQFDVVFQKSFCFPPKLKKLYFFFVLHGSNLCQLNNRNCMMSLVTRAKRAFETNIKCLTVVIFKI